MYRYNEAARGGAPDLATPLGAQLLALATPLLDACAADVATADPGSPERAAAREEYVVGGCAQVECSLP